MDRVSTPPAQKTAGKNGTSEKARTPPRDHPKQPFFSSKNINYNGFFSLEFSGPPTSSYRQDGLPTNCRLQPIGPIGALKRQMFQICSDFVRFVPGRETPLNGSGSSCNFFSVENQPRRPIITPFRGLFHFLLLL